MKKAYIIPSMEIVKIELAQMIATSSNMTVNNTELTGDVSGAARGADGDFDD